MLVWYIVGREHREKYDLYFNANGTVTYRENVWYEFVRNMSAGDETDKITTVNMVLVVGVHLVYLLTESYPSALYADLMV